MKKYNTIKPVSKERKYAEYLVIQQIRLQRTVSYTTEGHMSLIFRDIFI